MLWILIVLALVLWMVGFSFKIGGTLIHLLIIFVLFAVIVQIRANKKIPK